MTSTEHFGEPDAGVATPPVLAAWPRSQLPVPHVYRPNLSELDGDVLVLEMPSTAAGSAVAIPEELFLRELLDVDLGDPRSIARFTADYGLLLYSRARRVGNYGAEQRFWSPSRDLEELRRALVQELQERADSMERSLGSLAVDPDAMPLLALLRSVQAQLVREYPPGVMALHVDDFRLLAAEYRDLVRIWVDVATGGDRHAAGWESHHLLAPEDPSGFLASRLGLDLRRFAPRLIGASEPAAEADLLRTWSLNVALAGQLFNDVVERPTYRRCALPDCGRVFARARGRSQQGRHRSDAKFCSKSCADVAMKRRQRASRATA